MSGTAAQSPGFHWDPEWRIVLLAVLLLPLFIGLGFWQLSRAEEKREVGARWAQQRLLPPVPLASLGRDVGELAYRPVTLRGEFLQERDFLLDNRTRQGRYGVDVLTPMRLESGELVLVNRGWMPGDPSRRELPRVAPVPGEQALQGFVYVPPGESYTLGEIAAGEGWPQLVQAIDLPTLGDLLGEPLWPYTVRLSMDSPAALLADWPLVSAQPEKHEAYAAQWFAMALVLALFALWRNSNLPELWRVRRAGEGTKKGLSKGE